MPRTEQERTQGEVEQLKNGVFELVLGALGSDPETKRTLDELKGKPLTAENLTKLQQCVGEAAQKLISSNRINDAQKLLGDYARLQELVAQNQPQTAPQARANSFLSLNDKSASNLSRLATGFQQQYTRALQNFEKAFSLDASTQEIFKSLTSGGDHLKSYLGVANDKKTYYGLNLATGKALSQLDALSWVYRKANDMPGGATAENIRKAYEEFKKENAQFFVRDKDGKEVFRVTDSNLKAWLDNREKLGERLGRVEAGSTIKWDQLGMVWKLNNEASENNGNKIAIRPHLISNSFQDHLITSVAAAQIREPMTRATQTTASAQPTSQPQAPTPSQPQGASTGATASGTQAGAGTNTVPGVQVTVDKQKTQELAQLMLDLSKSVGVYSESELALLEKIRSDKFDGKLDTKDKEILAQAVKNTLAYYYDVVISENSNKPLDVHTGVNIAVAEAQKARIYNLARDAGVLEAVGSTTNSTAAPSATALK